MRRSWAVAAAAVILYFLIGYGIHVGAGLTRSILCGAPPHNVLDVRHVDSFQLPSSFTADTTAVWDGAWDVGGGAYDLLLESPSNASWTIDGVDVVKTSGGTSRRTVWLTPGVHRIQIRCALPSSGQSLGVAAAHGGRPLQPLSREALAPEMPTHPWLHSIIGSLRTMVGWLALVACLWALRRSVGTALTVKAPVPPWLSRALAWSTLAVILVHGTLLRIDAIAGHFDVVSHPGWARAIETRTIARPDSIRPSGISWPREAFYPHADGVPTHYRSDPYIYLAAARAMTSFYMAHFREPVFPFLTKISLALFGGQDVAVSFASTACSMLAVWFTYILGAAVWSRPAGLLAALGLSLDLDVVSLASFGWRDDAYMAVFTICAYLMVRYAGTADAQATRVYRIGRWQLSALRADAVLLGIGTGLAVLTRIMAVPFVVAGMAWIFIGHRADWRRLASSLALAGITAIAVAAPYFINCWRVFGDPLYTFNVHGAIYSASEGHPGFRGSTASYVRNKIVTQPVEVVDTVAQGLTTYPFSNKFHGLDPWYGGIDRWVASCSLAGLLLLAAFPAGRLLLVLTAAALLPFSLTWPIDPDYRFTLFAYPILLVAAATAITAGVHAILRWPAEEIASWRAAGWRPWAATVGSALLLLWFVQTVSPSLVVAAALAAGEDVSVTAGGRDSASFGRGWSDVIGSGNVRERLFTDEAVLRLRLPAVAEYHATIRMDPFPRPQEGSSASLPTVAVVLNGTRIATVPLHFTAERVGAYEIVLPQSAVLAGSNELLMRIERAAGDAAGLASPVLPGLSEGDAVAMWYVRLHPLTPMSR